jgi:glycine cleavage system H protein
MKYSKDHEWLTLDGDIATIGITNHAQEQLGDVVYIELPKIGAIIAANSSVATVESVKAASEVYTPVSGEVIATNSELSGDPALVNRAAENAGWFMKVKLSAPSELNALMDKTAYDEFVAG